MALSRAGVQQYVADLSENTAQANACSRWYDLCRQSVLEELPWPFALRLETLALVETGPNAEWSYSYRYPADAVRLNRILASLNYPVNYEVGGDDNGRLIYCNYADVEMWYNANIETPGHFSSMFADALSWRIAKEIGPLLRVSESIQARAGREYVSSLNRAAGHAQAEQNPLKRVAKAISVRESANFLYDLRR